MTLRKPSDSEESIARYRSLGVEAASFIRAHWGCYPAEVAEHLGISGRTYRHWLASEDAAYEAFQRGIEPALVDQAKEAVRAAEKDINAAMPEKAAGAKVSWHTWLLEKRLPKFFGKDAAVTVQVNNQVNVSAGTSREQVLADLKAEAAVNPELAEALRALLE